MILQLTTITNYPYITKLGYPELCAMCKECVVDERFCLSIEKMDMIYFPIL